MTFGGQATEPVAHAILDRALEAGVAFVDAADIYPVPGTIESAGRTEEVVGRWLKGRRQQVVLGTKCGVRVGPGPNDAGLSRHHILDAAEASLRRLESVHPPSSLLAREIERELLPLCSEEGLGVVTYSPLAGGLLSGKYRADTPPPAATRFGP